MDDTAGTAIARIENVLESIVDSILAGSEMSIDLRTRPRSRRQLDTVAGAVLGTPNVKTHSVKFPGRSAKEARKFRIIFDILKVAHEALVNGIPVTKRDIYYHNPELFGSQQVVDRYVDDLAFTLDLNRHNLGIVATARGLVVGSLRLVRRDGSHLHKPEQDEPTLVHGVKSLRVICEETRWILMVEKEATFSSLAKSRYWETSAAGRGVVITGKGYPDIQTRALLRLLHHSNPVIPIFGLVDFDPDGISIVSAYKYGTVALAHENQDLVVPHLQWLGMKSRDITHANSHACGLLQLTGRDRKKAKKMLEEEILQEEWKRELQIMLMLNLKWEIQLVNQGSGLETWLNERLEV